MRSRAALAIGLGAAVLLWPAFANGYPLLFSDTGAFLAQLLAPFMIWDKPWVYGPVLAVLSLKITLWLPALAQAVLVSWLVWRVLEAMRMATPARHAVVLVGLSLATAAPWFVSLLMPDILAPATVLVLFLLAFPVLAWRSWPLHLLGIFVIASHLTHLVIAAACLSAVALVRPRALPRLAIPVVGALALLFATNVIGHGRAGISPFGAVFALARLVEDGPARDHIHNVCPQADYRLCAWVGRLPPVADQFLWSPEGPVWTTPGGPIALAEEAGRIVRATMREYPLEVAQAAFSNTFKQLITLRLDEVIGDYWLNEAVGLRLRAHYPAAEEARFQAAAQRHDRLRPIAAPWNWPQMAAVIIAALLCPLVFFLRAPPALRALTGMILLGILANAFATGALSGPHDRYGARMAWLLLLPPLLWLASWAGDRTNTDIGTTKG